jgi:hypothetical protein
VPGWRADRLCRVWRIAVSRPSIGNGPGLTDYTAAASRSPGCTHTCALPGAIR